MSFFFYLKKMIKILFLFLIPIFMTILLNRSFSYAISLDDLPNDSGNGAKIIIVCIFFLIIYHNEVKKYILPSKNNIVIKDDIINNDIIVVDKNLLEPELISKEEIDLNNIFVFDWIDIIFKIISTGIIVYCFGVFVFFFSLCFFAIYDYFYPQDPKILLDKKNKNNKKNF